MVFLPVKFAFFTNFEIKKIKLKKNMKRNLPSFLHATGLGSAWSSHIQVPRPRDKRATSVLKAFTKLERY